MSSRQLLSCTSVCVCVCRKLLQNLLVSPTQKLAYSKSITSRYVGKTVDILLPNQTSRDLHPKHKIA